MANTSQDTKNALAGIMPIGNVTELVSKVDGTLTGQAVTAASLATTGTVSAVGVINTGISTTSIGASTAALGTTVTDAAALPAGTANVYPTTAADDTVGVKFTASDQVTGRMVYVGNGVPNKILKVYGPSGAVINGASANAAFSSVSGKGVVAVCLSGAGNTWLMW